MKLELNNGKWQVVKNGEVRGTFATIKAAQDFKFEQTRRPERTVQYFKQDGTAVTKRPSMRRA